MRTSSSAKGTTIYDLAQATGLSKTTVSDCLRGNGRIAPETRELVMKTAQEMGYEGNYFAQRLKGGSPQLIPLVMLNLGADTLIARALRIQQLLLARGFDVPLHGSGMAYVEDASHQVALIAGLRRQKPRAIIFHSYGLRAEALGELARYQQEGGQVLGFGTEAIDLDCDQVRFDASHGVYKATRHLLKLGHQRVGLWPPGGVSPDHPWYQGWERALRESKIELDPGWMLIEGEIPYSFELSWEDSGQQHAESFMNWEKHTHALRPTALCIINDRVAAAFVHTMIRAGHKVPDEVSVVSYDDTPVARHCVVPLSAVAYPVEQIAQAVVQLLNERLDESYAGAPRERVVHGQLTIRDSSAAPRGDT